MISHLSVKNFKGVPYLEGSQLMLRHARGLAFSSEKANVIVGPNGSGKSALLSALATRFLAHQTGVSSFDDNYISGSAAEAFWTKTSAWGRDFEFLAGLTVDTDNAPAFYYRPNHIPGNDHSTTAAMLCGYYGEARAYAAAVNHKSSGEGNRALLTRIRGVLAGEKVEPTYNHVNWRYGVKPRELSRTDGWVGEYDYKAEALKKLFAKVRGTPLILLDEPEQSLDVLAQATLWRAIE
jgi:ABC-type cobalamin/Fe3+-siderophores transport system ATPase subunit